MITIAIVGVPAALAGYVIGRARSVGRHHEHAFQSWRDRVIGAALMPRIEPPVLELTAEATP